MNQQMGLCECGHDWNCHSIFLGNACDVDDCRYIKFTPIKKEVKN